jgi:hypothetical protein
MQQPGTYRVALPHDISPGIYTVAFKAGNQRVNKIIVVSK